MSVRQITEGEETEFEFITSCIDREVTINQRAINSCAKCENESENFHIECQEFEDCRMRNPLDV